jgi:hypothetical protein
MTLATETVLNKALSGEELKTLIRADFERLLTGEGLLSHYLAYGRISYDITLRLHLDNPMCRESAVTVAPRASADGTLSPPPIANATPEAVVSGVRATRAIDSPNAERLRAGIPIPVRAPQQDGTVTTEFVRYPLDPSLGEGDITVADISPETRAAWKLPEPTA